MNEYDNLSETAAAGGRGCRTAITGIPLCRILRRLLKCKPLATPILFLNFLTAVVLASQVEAISNFLYDGSCSCSVVLAFQIKAIRNV